MEQKLSVCAFRLLAEKVPMLLLQLANGHRRELIDLVSKGFLHASTSWT